MPAYPSYPQLVASRGNRRDEVIAERASNGALRARALWSGAKAEFEIEHILTLAEQATLDAFYDSNRTADLTLTWSADGLDYTVIFAGPPEHSHLGAGYVRTRVRLAQV